MSERSEPHAVVRGTPPPGDLASEWAALVMAAMLGTDRRPPPEAPAELAVWSGEPDPAVALLDRAAAVITARRAGALPLPGVAPLQPPPLDRRPACPPAAAGVLGEVLRREDQELLAEWLALLADRGWRLPPEHAPALLARTRGDQTLGAAALEAAGPLAAWLDAVLPPTGPTRRASPAEHPAPLPAEPGTDPVHVVLEQFVAGRAGSQRGALRASVLLLAPAELERLADGLDEITGQPLVAPLRHELADLARLRVRIASAFDDRSVVR
jgi:hypothetical protein